MGRWLVTVVVLVGCAQPRATGDAATVDVGPDAFDGWHMTGRVLPPDFVNEDDPTLTPEMDEMFFDVEGDIYTVRANGNGWTAQTRVVEISTADQETACELADNGLTMYFASNRAGGTGGYDIWVTTRVNRASPWSTPTPVTELNTPSVDLPGGVSGDGLTFVLVSDRGGNGDLYLSTRSAVTQPWSTPTRVAELSTDMIEQSAWLNNDATEIYFDVVDSFERIYQATRATPSGPFSAPQEVSELKNAFDPWVSPDGHHMYYVAGTPSGIYHATRGL